MPFKMKGTAMYDKTMDNGKPGMMLKKEFGGPMQHKVVAADGPKGDPHAHVNVGSTTGLPMKSPMDKSPMDKSPMDKAPMDLRDDSAMDMSHMKLTQDAAMKLTSAMKKMSPMEANAFIGAKMAAEKAGESTFEVDGKKYNVR